MDGRTREAYSPVAAVAPRANLPHHVPVANSYSYAVGPLMAFAFLGVLVLLVRWTFQRGKSVVAAPARPGQEDDYGMLVPVASPTTYVEGEISRRTLEDAGIRATLAKTLDGPRLLVWPDDADRARATLSPGPGRG